MTVWIENNIETIIMYGQVVVTFLIVIVVPWVAKRVINKRVDSKVAEKVQDNTVVIEGLRTAIKQLEHKVEELRRTKK